jgi:hypothetical protein
MNEEMQLLYSFFSGFGFSQDIFENLVFSTLKYKYGNNFSVIYYPITGKLITESIFGLNRKDKIKLADNLILDGQKLKEFFIANIFLRHLDKKYKKKEKTLVVAYPKEEKAEDIVIDITNPNDNYVDKEGKLRLSRKGIGYNIQVKEFFKFDEKDIKMIKIKDIEESDLLKFSDGYREELVLIYCRVKRKFDYNKIKDYLDKNRNVALIVAPMFFQKWIEFINIKNGKKERLYLKENEFNFIIFNFEKALPVSFKKPRI